MRLDFKKADKVTAGDFKEAMSEIYELKQASDSFEGTSTRTYKIKGLKESTKEAKALVAIMDELDTTLSKQTERSSLKLFGSQEKVINNLKQAWNDYATAIKNGLISREGTILVNDEKDPSYKKAKQIQSNLMKHNSAFETVFDGTNVLSDDIKGQVEEIRSVVKDVIASLSSQDSFKNYSLSPEKLKPVYDYFKNLQSAAEKAKVSMDDVMAAFMSDGDKPKQLFQGFSFDVSGDIVTSLLSVEEQSRSTARSEEEAAEAAEESAERQKKAYESVEEIKRRINSTHQKKQYTNDEEYNNDAYWESTIDYDKQEENRLKELMAVYDKLQEKKKQYQNWLEGDEFRYEYESKKETPDQNALNNAKKEIEDEYAELLKINDLIDYISKARTDAAMNFKPGDSWGEDEIGVTIKLLQDLSEQINTIKESFSTIKSPEEFQVLITSIESVSEKLRELTSSFNSAFTSFDDNGAIISITTYFESLIATIQELQKTMSQLDMSFNVKFGSTSNSKSPLEMADERRREQEAIYDQLLQERSEIESRIYGRFKSAQSPTQMIMSLFGNRKTPGLQNYPEWSAFAEEYSSQAIDAQFKKSMSGANSSLKRYIQKIVAGANLAGIDVSDIVSKYQPKDVDTGKTVSNVNELADAEDKAQKASEQMSDALSKLIKTTDLSPIIEQLETLVKQITQISESFAQLTESINNGLQISAKETAESLQGATAEIKAEGEAAATATPLKEQMTEANKKLAESAERTAESTKTAADGIESEGDASKNGKTKKTKETEYDDEKMKARAKAIDDATAKMRNDFQSQGLVTSIQRMYDSHDNLVQAILTTKKQVEDEDGRLAEQVEHFNIHWDKKGDELYSSTMTRDDYEKYNQKVAEEIDKKREQAELRRVKEERKINEQQVRLMNKAQEDKWKESEKVRKKAEKEQQLEQEKLNSPEYRYNVAYDKIKALGEANTRVLDLKTKQSQGIDVTDQMIEALDNVTQKAKEAKDALDEIYKSKDIPIGKRDEINKLYNSADIQIGDAKSRDRYRQAQSRKIDNDLNKQNAQDFKKDIDVIDQYIRKQKELNDLRIQAIKTNLSSEQSDRKEALESETQAADLASEAYERLKAARDAGDMTESQLSRFKNVADSYNSIIDGSSISTKVGQNRDSLFTTIDKTLNKAYAAGDRENGGWRPEGWQDKISELKSRISDLKEDAKNIDILSPNAAKDFEDLREKILQVQTDYTNLSKSEEWKPVDTTWEDSFTNKVAKWAEQNKIAAKEFREELEKIREDAKGIDNEFDAAKLENRFSKVQTDAADRNLLGKSLGDRFKDQFKNTMTSLATYYLSFQDFIRYGREAIQTVTQLDTAMVELKKVSDESAQSYSNFAKQSFDMADQVGTTSEQIIQSTADWKRLGRSFEESKKLAQQSTVLMNVSEFENINDATEAMVSATQAYTDVASEDIIDKLNNVGNNYAVGTSELAKGLQNAAAVLKTQGNDIDEALALLTAGNLIGQDMSKASAGIRTISLRISGTEEAKNEIAEMGEDVDDFVVRTKSKTDQIIRDYTAVASNAHQGISVLDDNGNLRDTYSILLDISKIYKEIQEEDKQYGTNRAQALVETLAGKNRSNIASSILLNGDILESVYNASKNESKGSAQHELETYLDSIEGKTAKLQNRIQELTSTAVDSEFIKTAIDGLTKILELANSLVDTFGALPTVLGAVGGVLMQKNGWGILSKDKGTKSFGLGFAKNIKTALSDGFTKVSFSDELSKIFDGADMSTVIDKQWVKSMGGFDKLPQALQNYIQECDAAGESTITLGGAMNALGKQTSSLSGAFSALGSIGLEALSTLGTMALMTVVSMGIQAAITGIHDLIHADEIAIEKGKEAQENISDTATSYNEQRESLSGLQKEYAKLSTGVNVSNGSVKNRNLSEDEFSRYLEISQQISEIAPELVTGYDQQGAAIVNLGSTVDGVNEKFEDYLKLQRDIANAEIGGSLDSVWTGLEKEAKSYKEQLDSLQDTQIAAANQHAQSITSINQKGEKQSQINNETITITVDTDDASRLHDILYDNDLWRSEYDTGKGTTEFAVDLKTADEKTLNALNAFFDKSELEGSVVTNLAEAQQKKTQLLLDQTYQKIIPSVQEYIRTNSIFDNIESSTLSESMRDGLSDMMSRIDYKSVSKDIDDAGGLENWVDGIIATMSIDDPAVQHAFDDLFKLEEKRDTMQLSDYLNKRNELYQQLEDRFGEDYLSTDQLAVMFGNATRDEDGNYHDTLNDRIQSAGEKIGFGGDVNFYRQISTAPIKYAESALSAIESMPQKKAKEIAGNWDKFWEYIEPYLTGKNIKSEAPTDTFATLLNDESYKTSAETASSHLSSLTGALETLRTEGQLTAEEMVNLQNSFPDLTEFTTESIQTKAFEELDEWIGKIREGMKGMSEEGKEQARTMIQNMIDQYGDLGLDVSDIRKSYIDSNKAPSHYKGLVGEGFDMKVEELRSRLADEGIELDTHVLYTLVASDQFSGTADEIYDKYKDVEFFWDIILENQDLEKDITKQQALVDNYQAIRSSKEANGEIITSGDYGDISALEQIAEDRRQEAQNAWDLFISVTEEDKDANYVAWLNAETAARNAEAEAVAKAKEQQEAGANEELANLEKSNDTLADAQRAITAAEKDGGKASSELYESVASQYDNQAETNRKLGDIFQGLADNTTNQAWKTEWTNTANDYYDKALQAEADAKEQRLIPLQNEYNELQNEATAIEHELTEAEQKHQKVSTKTYQDLIANGKAQIRNLQKQQSKVKEYSEDWWTLQNSIDSMNDSIYDWSSTMDSLVYDQAAQLAQTISTAMSESFSETGLTDDTINALKTAFSDLDGSRFDVSDAFYSTADGVKVNTEALQELTEAEFELIGSPLANEIANVQEQLERDPGNSALQDKLDNLMETNAKYFAQYEEMQKALSRNAAIDLAESTSNAGANYDENYGRVKTYKEAYEKGLTGTDDFKAWTSYLDVYGRDTVEAYEAVSGKIERYFTEDAADGLGNFLTDMEKLGYAAQDADGYWTITADDYDAAAKDMQMGSEWFMDTMNKLEDFGFIHTYVSSLNEAQLKTRDVEEQIADAVQTYSDMVARGASDEDLQKQIEHINELESQWQDLDTVTKTWGETTEENRKKEFLGLDDQLAAFEEMYKNADTDAGRDAARKAAEDYVKQFGYTLEEGKFKLSADDLVDYESRFKKGSVKNPLSAEDMGVSEENEDTYRSFVEQIQKRYGKDGDFGNLLNNIHNLSAEELKLIDHADGSWSEGESSLEQICDTLGVSYENADLLIDALAGLGLIESPGVLDSVPEKMQDLQDYLSTATKENGEAYQISTNVAGQSVEQLQTQLDEIDLAIKAQLDPDSDVYKQLEELKKQTEIQLNIKNSDQTQTQLKEWAEAGDRENIAKTFGIDVNSEEVDKYIEQINNMPSDYDLAIHIDDSQFQTLIESITGKPYQAEVEVVGKDKLTQFVSKIRTKLQNNPITQPIVQKVQQFGQKVKEKITATVNTGDSNKQVDKVENSVEDLNKTTGTAKVNVNTKGALSNIQNVRNQLLSLNSVVATPRINVITGNATSIISQIRDAINQLRDKTVTLTTIKREISALGTAHASGTTSLSRAYASGSQDWTVGRDESALVNEIGQESRVRDGVWELIPGGPHVEDLKKDDIIN